MSKERKFYDLEPGEGSHYLCENGVQIARFDDLVKAEAVRELYMQAEAARLHRKIDEVYLETRTEGIKAAYLDLKAEQGGLSAVSIGKLLERTGLPKKALHSFLLEEARAGNADLHPSTLINLSAEDREGLLPVPGSTEPAITVTQRRELAEAKRQQHQIDELYFERSQNVEEQEQGMEP